MGEDITYSGTASAAMEAVLQGIPAVAISQVCRDNCQSIKNGWDFALAKHNIKQVVTKIFEDDYPIKNRRF